MNKAVTMLNLIFIAIFAFTNVYTLELDYYWKDYTGQIPRDAVVGGQSSSGDNFYIGQAYVDDGKGKGGIIVAEIRPNITEVSVPYFGVRKSRFGLKILCSTNPTQLTWMRSNSTQLHLDLIGKNVVIGGVENGFVLYIGRVVHNAETKIGKLGSFNADNSVCYFVSGDSEQSAQSYEVLIFNKNTTGTAPPDPNIIPDIDIRDGPN